jgi:hypothetical protein
VSDSLAMLWIHTHSISAKVVKFHAVWHWTIDGFPIHDMRVSSSVFTTTNLPIPVYECSLPCPAFIHHRITMPPLRETACPV